MQIRSLTRSWASPLLALALLLAACGGQSDTELATIDDGTERVGDDADAGGPDEPAAAIIETVDRPDDDDDTDVELPVPEAVEPPPPGVASSPAQRQQQQELGLVASSEPEAPDVVVPGISDVDAPAGAAPAEVAPAVERADLDQFPDTIPAIVPGAPQGSGATGPAANNAGSGGSAPSNSFSASVEPEAIIGAEDASGVVPEPDGFQGGAVIESDTFVAEPEFALDLDECSSGDCVVAGDIASMQGDGIGDAAGAASSQDTAGEDDVSALCVVRPYARGCTLPVPEVYEYFDESDEADADEDAFTTSGGAPADDGAEGAGVDVPQDVLDALLAPADNDPAAGGAAGGSGVGDGGDDVADGDPQASASPDSPSETLDP